MNFLTNMVIVEKQIWHIHDSESTGFSRKEKLLNLVWRLIEILLFRTSPQVFSKWRVALLRGFGAKIGKNCYISNRATVMNPWNITIGDNCGVDDYVFLKGGAKIVIGNNVSIGAYAKIIPGGHDVRTRNFRHVGKQITIGNGVFIGADAFIGSGVKIGTMAVVGARTSVFKDVPENTIITQKMEYKTIKRLSDDEYESFSF